MRPVPSIRTRTARLLLTLGVGAALAVSGAAPALAASGPTTYYVSCHTGKATGDGTRSNPWTALWQVQSHGAYAPGDQILLRRGTTCSGSLAPTGSGTSAAPIVLGQWGSGASLPIIAGGGTRTLGAVQLVDVAYWTVRDLHITNTDGVRNTRASRSGLLFESTTGVRQAGLAAVHLTVDHVDSDPAGARAWGGISAYTRNGGGGFSGMRITSSTVLGVGRSGIAVTDVNYPRSTDTGLRIDHNAVRWVRGDSIIVDGVSDARIDDNTSAYGSNLADCPVSHCGRMGSTSTATAAIWPIHATRVLIDHNEVYGEHASAGDGDAIDADLYTTDVVIEHNYLHDNGRGGLSFCGAQNATARFNVLQNNHGPSIVFTCGWARDQHVRGITIANNTIWSAKGAAWVVRSMHPNAGAGIRFVNNLVQCTGGCAYSWPPSRPSFVDNTFSGSHAASQPRGSGAVNGSLGLRSPGRAGIGFASAWGYHLQPGTRPSHGIGIGIGLTDFYGHAVSSTRPVRGAASS